MSNEVVESRRWWQRRGARARAGWSLSLLLLLPMPLFGFQATATRKVQYTADAPVRLDVEREQARGEVDARFLSFALDSSQVSGGHWWAKDGAREWAMGKGRIEPISFAGPRLLALTRALAPAYLRVGGTEADHLRYAFGAGSSRIDQAARKQGPTLDAELWDSVLEFAGRAQLDVAFTVNAGPMMRDGEGAWRGERAQPLLAYTRAHEKHVALWELGNEVNAYWLTQSPPAHVSPPQYARDLQRFAALVHRYMPGALVAGPSSAYWPVLGETPFRMLEEVSRSAGRSLDVVTWHYYPQQSRRCWAATRRASADNLLDPDHLDEVGRIAERVSAHVRRHLAHGQSWLGETGGAQCGGEPGLSDRFLSSLWWLDELGQAAQHGQRVVVRQTLFGSDYGLLDDQTFAPRPDYWASRLFKLTMGERVLSLRGELPAQLRAYAHCGPTRGEASGELTLLLINLDRSQTFTVDASSIAPSGRVWRVEASDPLARAVRINGHSPNDESDLASWSQATDATKVALKPLSYALVVLPATDVAACQVRSAAERSKSPL